MSQLAIQYPAEHKGLIEKGYNPSIRSGVLYRGNVCTEWTYSKAAEGDRLLAIVQKYVKDTLADQQVKAADSLSLGFDTSVPSSMANFFTTSCLSLETLGGHSFLSLIKPSGLSGFVFLPYSYPQGALFFSVFSDHGGPLTNLSEVSERGRLFARNYGNIEESLKSHFQVNSLQHDHFKQTIVSIDEKSVFTYGRNLLNEKVLTWEDDIIAQVLLF